MMDEKALSHIANTMAADVLAAHGTRASAESVLTQFSRGSPVSAPA